MGTNKFIPGLFHPSLWGRGIPLSATTGIASRAAANTLGTNTILDAFSSVRTFVPALRQGLISAGVGWASSVVGFEAGVVVISAFQAGGDEVAWFLFPDPK
jgi:hypothetical protein